MTAADAALLDALAVLFLGYEEGRRLNTIAEPVKRSVSEREIVYGYIEPNSDYGSTKTKKEIEEEWGFPIGRTDEELRLLARSKYSWIHSTFRLVAPCLVRAESTIEYSDGESKDAFGVHVVTQVMVIDLRNHRLLEFQDSAPFSVAAIIKGDDLLCYEGEGGSCLDEYESRSTLEGVGDVKWRIESKRKAVEHINRSCPAKSG